MGSFMTEYSRKFFKKNFNLKYLIEILLSGGFVFALLYFFGYSYLKRYFGRMGGTMIPISDLSAIEIAILGLMPLLLFLLFYYFLYRITRYFFKKYKKIKKN